MYSTPPGLATQFSARLHSPRTKSGGRLWLLLAGGQVRKLCPTLPLPISSSLSLLFTVLSSSFSFFFSIIISVGLPWTTFTGVGGGGSVLGGPRPLHIHYYPELTNPAAFNFHQVESQDRLPRSKTCRTLTIGTGVGPSWTAAPFYLQCPLPS